MSGFSGCQNGEDENVNNVTVHEVAVIHIRKFQSWQVIKYHQNDPESGSQSGESAKNQAESDEGLAPNIEKVHPADVGGGREPLKHGGKSFGVGEETGGGPLGV